jgi:hypothetical protein
MEEAKELFRKILLRYNKDPKGWDFLVGRSREGFFDFLISHDREVWQIKLDTLYKPEPLGVGAKVGRVEKKIFDHPYSFGFRPISEEQIRELAEARVSTKIIKDILESKPRPIDEIKTPGMVQGPITFSGSPVDFISEKHRALDMKLRKDLEKLLTRSGIMTAYG